ncbi:MAG: DNA-binding protein [Planctomycetota bacterium]|nr:MAG: DNA-binding protein [Planctomycetota bacterium]
MTTKTKANKPMSKSEITLRLSETTGLSKQQINGVFEALTELVGEQLSSGPGVFTFPGLLKIKVVHKPATPERTGINPFTKEPTVFKAKPARNQVKLQALKNLKQMV